VGDSCASDGFSALRSKPRRRGKRVRFSFVASNPVDATIFRRSNRRRVVRQKVKTFRNRGRAFTWAPRRARNGNYDVRFKTSAPNGTRDVRHLAVRRRNGRFYRVPEFDRRSMCSLVRYASLGRSVFGGRRRTPVRVRFNLANKSRVAIKLARRGKVVRRIKAKNYPRGGNRVKFRLGRKAKRGPYRVTLKATAPGRASEQTLSIRYL
jgi:hypothetical protein